MYVENYCLTGKGGKFMVRIIKLAKKDPADTPVTIALGLGHKTDE